MPFPNTRLNDVQRQQKEECWLWTRIRVAESCSEVAEGEKERGWEWGL